MTLREPLTDAEDAALRAQPVWDSFGLLDFTLSSWRGNVAFNVHDDD